MGKYMSFVKRVTKCMLNASRKYFEIMVLEKMYVLMAN